VLEQPRWDLTWFKVHFGLLTLKASTNGEHVLRVEATVHNTRELGCGRVPEQFPEIIGRLAGMAERFCTTLDCVDAGFVTDQTLDELPRPCQLGRTKVGGVDLDQPRMRAALAAVLALAAAPRGFTVAELTAKVQAMTGLTETGSTIRQAAYDLRKLRGKHPASPTRASLGVTWSRPQPPARSRPCPPCATRVIGPILAGVRSPRLGRKPAHWTAIDRDYETLRIGMQALFYDLGIAAATAAA
jgi:hypothetical protein